MAVIQEDNSSNWIIPTADVDRSKAINKNIEIARGIKVKKLAIYLISFEESPGTKEIMIVPATGRNIMSVR